MADVEDQGQQPPAAAPLGGGGGGNDMRHIKLSDFWPHAPQLWFSQTECRFAAHGIINEFARYCLVVGALPHDSLRRVADIVETPPQDTPYTTIKQRLLGAHQMTDYQRAEKLYLSPPIGDRKPSEMMAAMLEMCPRGEEKTNLFACLFLQRLPREIRVLLSRVDHKDPKLLAEEADALWTLHGQPAAIAAVPAAFDLPITAEDSTVAAVRQGIGSRSRGRGSGGRGRGKSGGGGAARPTETQASREARMAAGICYKHWRFGENAYQCEQPCNWAGNAPAGGN
jgi:hypothetical protein